MILGWVAGFCSVASLHAEMVTVYALDGTKISGNLLVCTESVLKIQTQSGEVELACGTLDRLETSQASGSGLPRQPTGTELATLIDGSQVACQGFGGRDDRWTAKSMLGSEWDFPKKSVESLLMGTLTESLRKEWDKAMAEPRSSDEMVVARSGDAMDRASGMVVAITPEVVEFSFDGQVLQAPRKKLLGLLWYRPQEKRVEPAIQIRTLDGSIWEAISIALSEPTQESNGGLRWTTPCGVEAMASWNEIGEVNFAVANIVWLASQTPLVSKTFQRSLLAGAIPGRDALLGPRFYSSDSNKSTDAKSQDLLFSGPSEISFRVPEGFKRFVAKVRRFEKASYSTSVNCKVWIGDSLAWEATMAPDQLETLVDIPVVSEQKLRIVVTCDSDLLLGTQLSWLQPRLTR